MAVPRRTKKDHVACPFCYVSLDLKALAFRCSGTPEAGRTACVTHQNPVRMQLLGDSSELYPPVLRTERGHMVLDRNGWPELLTGKLGSTVDCNRCGGKASVLLCPHCQSILPEQIGQGSLSIGVVGARNSGKTVWLSTMEKQLGQVLPGRFKCSIDHPGGVQGLASELVAHSKAMDNHHLPGQTEATGGKNKAPAVFRWTFMDGRARVLSLYDTAGEDVANRDNALVQQHLVASNAVVLVLDPFTFPENRDPAGAKGVELDPDHVTSDVLDGLTSVMEQTERARTGQQATKVSTPLAVVISKMDAFWDDLDPGSPLLSMGTDAPYFDDAESRQIHELLKEQVRRWGAAQVVNKIESAFSNYRFFGVSALGHEPDYGTGSLIEGPTPTRASDPLLWILHEAGFVPGGGR